MADFSKRRILNVGKSLLKNAGEQLKDSGKIIHENVRKATDSLPREGEKIDWSKAAHEFGAKAKEKGSAAVSAGREGLHKMQEGIENLPRDENGDIDVRASFEQMGSNALDAIEKGMKDQEETSAEKARTLDEINAQKSSSWLSVRASLDLMYAVMNADNQITSEEEAKFREFCGAIEADENEALADIAERAGDMDAKAWIDQALSASKEAEKKTVSPALLLWDLLAAAWSDGTYSDDEKNLILYIRRQLGIDRSVQMEMEQDCQTIDAIEKEKIVLLEADWSGERKKRELDELAKREETVREGMGALITD